jgi:hypothetical protein
MSSDTIPDAVCDDVDTGLGDRLLDLFVAADGAIHDPAERGTRGDCKRVHSNGRYRARARPWLSGREPRSSCSGEAGELVCRLREESEKIREEFVEGFCLHEMGVNTKGAGAGDQRGDR